MIFTLCRLALTVSALEDSRASIHFVDVDVEGEGPLVDVAVREATLQDHLRVVVADCSSRKKKKRTGNILSTSIMLNSINILARK